MSEVKTVKKPACTVAGGYQTDIDKPEQFYNFNGEEMKAIFSLGDEISSYFFDGTKPMHIFGGEIADDKTIESWMTKRVIPEAEYAFFRSETKTGEPYDEGRLQSQAWEAVNKWMDGQTEYIWDDNDDIPMMIVASTENIGYNLYKAIKKRN